MRTCLDCGALIPSGSRCERHEHERRREKARLERLRSPSALSGGGTRRWRAIRAAQLAREPLCRVCRAEGRLVPAVEVDHIRPRAQGGGDEPENLRSVCREHNPRGGPVAGAGTRGADARTHDQACPVTSAKSEFSDGPREGAG